MFFLQFNQLIHLCIQLGVHLCLVLLVSLCEIGLCLRDYIVQQAACSNDALVRDAVCVGNTRATQSGFLDNFLHGKSLNELPIPIQQTKPFIDERRGFQVGNTAGNDVQRFTGIQNAGQTQNGSFCAFEQKSGLIIDPRENRVQLPQILRGRPCRLIHVLLHAGAHLLHAEGFVIRKAQCFSLRHGFFRYKRTQTALHFRG